MKLQDKLQLLRKENSYSQEQLAEKLGVSRQTIGNWENGQAVPELSGLIRLSQLYGITIDRMVKDDDECNLGLNHTAAIYMTKTISFLILAKQKTYAGYGAETASTRIASHDLQYQEGDYFYYDTYLGGECFSGEEAVWFQKNPIWSMNYSGRVVGDSFNGDFLKEALSHVSYETPYRGPAFYQNGDYSYHCRVDGEFAWFQGIEEILYLNKKIYECIFHGGVIK